MKDKIPASSIMVEENYLDTLYDQDDVNALQHFDKSIKSNNVGVTSEYLLKVQRFHALVITNILPTAGFIASIVGIFYWGIGWVEITSLFVMYLLTMIGAEIGFHRQFTHRSFKTTKTIEVILAILGSMCAQGPFIYWVANHRRHHRHSDLAGDPHSPHLHHDHGKGFWGTVRGLWYSHIEWQFTHEAPNTAKFAKDLLKDPLLRKVNNMYYIWLILGIAIPTLFGGLAMMSWKGALLGLLWGGLTRAFLVNHAIQGLNSICHVFGGQLFETREHSRNNILFTIPTLGQGWHNNHHAFPYSGIMGYRWYQIDPSAWILRLFEKMNLVWDIKMPTKQQVEEKLKHQ